MKQLTRAEFLAAALEEIEKDFGPFGGVDEAGRFDSYHDEETARQNSVIFFEKSELDSEDLQIEVYPLYTEKLDQIEE